MRRGPRRLAVIAGIGCIVLGAYAALYWKDVEASYYLHCFRRKPEYLTRALNWPRGTRSRAALESYAATTEGQDALLRIALGLHPEWLEALGEPGAEGTVVCVWPKQSSWSLCIWGEGRMRSVLEKLDERARAGERPWLFQGLSDLLAESPAPRGLLEYPGLSFAAWRSNSGYRYSVERITD